MSFHAIVLGLVMAQQAATRLPPAPSVMLVPINAHYLSVDLAKKSNQVSVRPRSSAHFTREGSDLRH